MSTGFYLFFASLCALPLIAFIVLCVKISIRKKTTAWILWANVILILHHVFVLIALMFTAGEGSLGQAITAFGIWYIILPTSFLILSVVYFAIRWLIQFIQRGNV